MIRLVQGRGMSRRSPGATPRERTEGRRAQARPDGRRRARRVLPGACSRAGVAWADRGGRRRGLVGARDRAGHGQGAGRIAPGGARSLARSPPCLRAHRRRARLERRAGASRDRRVAEPADTRAHGQGARERRDAERTPTRRFEPRAARRDRATDDGACRRDGRRSPWHRGAARRPCRAGGASTTEKRTVAVRRDRDARDRACDRRAAHHRPVHVRRRHRRARRRRSSAVCARSGSSGFCSARAGRSW